MVPVQTIFALLAVLVMMSSCSQEAPPHFGTTASAQEETTLNKVLGNGTLPNVEVSPTPQGPGITPASSETVDTSNLAGGTVKLTLSGIDAGTVYHLLAVKPKLSDTATSTTYVKQGSQFSCQHAKGFVFSCDFVINTEDGSIPAVLPLAQVDAFDSDAMQVPVSTNLLNVLDPSANNANFNKGSVMVKGAEAETLLKAVKGTIHPLIEDAIWEAGTRHQGVNIDCKQTKRKADPAATTICYLYFDLLLGTVDKIAN